MTYFGDDDLGRDVRASLHANADRAPDAELLAERIILAAERPAPDHARGARRTWRTWGLPLVAAGSVAAVVGVVVAVASYHPSARPSQPAVTRPAPSSTVAQPTPSATHPSPGSSSPTSPGASATSTDLSTLHHVVVQDVTFTGDDDGWALGAADCVQTTGRCTALLRTTDGSSWHSVAGTPFNVAGITGGCGYPCVADIRFADAQVGYAYGPSALLMTTDGGRHWQRQSGGASALETLDDNVIRVSTHGSGCPGACTLTVQTAPLGSAAWTTVRLPKTVLASYGVALSRAPGGDAYLLVLGHPAGGAGSALSTLFRSSDDGRSWTDGGEPCPQAATEVDSTAIAAAPDGRVAVTCVPRDAGSVTGFVATSTDGGAHFTRRAGAIAPATIGVLTGDATSVLVSAADGLSRSVDGGRSWQLVPSVTARIGFVGFEDATVGRALAADGSHIWTTRNAGRTWTKASFE